MTEWTIGYVEGECDQCGSHSTMLRCSRRSHKWLCGVCREKVDPRDMDAERRTAIGAAEGIMHSMLGYLPDEPGDARKLRELILAWLRRDAVRSNT